MPGGDGTGPGGMGPMTGRAAGFCAGFPVPGYANPMPGFGFGGGWGRGRGRGFGGRGRGLGWGRGSLAGYPAYGAAPYMGVPPYGPASGAYPYPPYAAQSVPPEQESAALKQQVQDLEGVLGDLRARLGELEGQKAK